MRIPERGEAIPLNEVRVCKVTRISTLFFIHVVNKTDELSLLAVSLDGLMLEYVENKTEEICIAAINQNIDAFELIDEETEAISLAISETSLPDSKE